MSSDRIVAISQPYYFPWLGACEIYSLADTYVFLDDVNFQKQGLNNRIRIKSSEGLKWMTVQLTKSSRNMHINMTSTFDFQETKRNHLSLFSKCYESSPFVEEALDVLRTGLEVNGEVLSDVAINSEKALFGFFKALVEKEIVLSSKLNRRLKGSQGVLEIVQLLKGNVYLTAHGAANYLDHEDFERNGIEVRYMNYGLIEYPQQFGQFTPYVSGLDAIANVGQDAKTLLSLETISWRDFLANLEKSSPQ
jgi:hypothetical protein